MTQTQIYYRLRIRNEDDSGNIIILSSFADDTNALLCEAPEGEGQSIDPIMGTLEVGSYTWQTIDRYDGGDTYTVTAVLADVDARNQLLSHKCVGEYSNDGSTWTALHSGYLNDIKLSDAKTYTFIVGDSDRRERDAVLFKVITDQFDRVSNIIGGPVEASPPVAYQGTPTRSWGPVFDYGPARMIVIANPSGLVTSTNRVTLSLVGGNLPPRYLGFQTVWNGKVPNPAEYIDQQTYQYFEADADGVYATDGSQQSQPWGSFPQIQVKLTKTSDSSVLTTFPIAQATRKASSYVTYPGGPNDWPVGDEKALVANSNDWLIIAWDVGTMGAQPSVGTTYDVLVRPLVISEANPLHLSGHPVDLHALANDQEGIAYDSASVTSTKAALGDLWYELRVTKEQEYSKFTEMLKSSAGYGTRYNSDGEQEFFPTRYAQPDEVATVTTAEIIGDEHGEPKDVIFKVSESSAIKGVDFTLQQFRLWSADLDSASDRPVDGVVATELTINGSRRDESVKGSKIVTFEVPGMIMLAGGAFVLNQPLALRDWIIEAGEVIIDRAGWGWPEGELEVLATVPGAVGDYIDLEAPHQVNAKIGQSPITQRGGTRKVQITKRIELPGTSKLTVKDAGNLAQDPPTAGDTGVGDATLPVPELSLAPSVDSPFTIATVTEANVSELQDINADTELQYLVQVATPASTDEGASFGPLLSSTGADAIDAPAIASGETIWVRGRAALANGLRGEWSAWISITLGPDETGTGATLAPFTLALSIDAAGSLSAEATSTVAEIITVYFLAGAAGGSAPAFDDVLLGATDTDGPPFTAANLATMAEGETRTVGAIGEDALGNRTLLVLASITRTPNTGAGAGTPGDLALTLIAGPPSVVRNVGSGLREPKVFKAARKYWNTLNMPTARLTHNVWEGASSGSELHWAYFNLTLDPGATTPIESGVWAHADREIFPEPGMLLPLAAGARGLNVLFTLATKGGDGTGTLKSGDAFIDTLSSVTPPPPSPTGDSSELPSGGAYGNIILDLNAFSLATELSLVDGDPVTTWPDDSISGNDASQVFGQSAPTYKSDGIGAGLPSVRFAAATLNGLSYDVPNQTTLTETRYFVVVPTTGLGTGARSFDNGVLFSGHGNNNISDIGVGLRSDGKLAYSVGENSIVATFRSVVTGTDTRGAVRIICVIRDGDHGAIYVDDMTTPAGSLTALDAQEFDDYPTEFIGIGGSVQVTSIAADYGRDVAYDAAHGAPERAGVFAVLDGIWVSGTLPGGGSGGSGGGGSTSGSGGSPPPAPSGPAPDYLATFTDPTTSATITRITGNPGDTIPTVGGTWSTTTSHHYSKDQPWSKDGTYIALTRGFPDYLIIDGSSYAPITLLSTRGKARWDPANDSKMICVTSSGDVGRQDVLTNAWTVVVASGGGYSGCDMGPAEGNPSFDGRYVVVNGTKNTTGHIVAFVADLTLGTKGSDLDLTAAGFTDLDWVSISAGGAYVVATGTIGGSSRRTRVWSRASLTLVQSWNDQVWGHYDLGLDGSTEVAWGIVGGSPNSKTFTTRALATGVVTVTTPQTTYYGHASCRSNDLTGVGYGVVNDAGGVDASFDGMIFSADLGGGGTTLICAHNSVVNGEYVSEPHAVPNRDGSKVMFASNWGESDQRPVQVYVVEGW